MQGSIEFRIELELDVEVETSWDYIWGWVGIVYVNDWQFPSRVDILPNQIGIPNTIIGGWTTEEEGWEI